MRIAIVNDLVIAIEAMRRVLLSVPDYQVIWTAKNGVEAIARCAQNTPDLILMDLFMPIMDGIEATRQIMKKSPCAILIVTADVKQSAAKVFEAMSSGALDAVNTPILGTTHSPDMAQSLLRKIATIEKLIRKSTPSSYSAPLRLTPHYPRTGTQMNADFGVSNESNPERRFSSSYPSTFRPAQGEPIHPVLEPAETSTHPPIHPSTPFPYLIAIGASTGGPKALATLLTPLPPNFAAAILIVQHIDAQFADGLIDWLDHQTALKVKKASLGDRPTVGTALVAATDDHLVMLADGSLAYIKDPIHYPYRPSVNVLYKSLARNWRATGTAILLTGMGRDGAEGLSLLKKQGWFTIAQDEASSVVYGMPKAAIELQAAIEVWSIDEISRHLLQKVH